VTVQRENQLRQEPLPNLAAERQPAATIPAAATRELGGREGPEPTRFGDWELRGRCIDF
jgi:hypothetical protein